MEVIYEKKTYRIVIVVNELEEFESSFRDKSKASAISIDSVLKESGKYITKREDVFVGAEANWLSIKDRLEEYYHLSFISSDSLEVHYYSDFGEITKAYTSDTSFLHFYDKCILKQQLLNKLAEFNFGFKANFHHKEIKELKQTNQSVFDLEKTLTELEEFVQLRLA